MEAAFYLIAWGGVIFALVAAAAVAERSTKND